MLLERRIIHIEDVLKDGEYRFVERMGVRTTLGVPMIREDGLLGVIVIWRNEVKPFTDRQVELVSTFADQAVIAIGNVRLFNETKEHAVARHAAGGVGRRSGKRVSAVEATIPARVAPRSRVHSSRPWKRTTFRFLVCG